MKRRVFEIVVPGAIAFVGTGVGLELGTGWGLVAGGILALGVVLFVVRVAGVHA